MKEFLKEKHQIGKIIREARRSSGVSQMKLAEKIGLSYQQIQKYEKGASEITVKRLNQIAEALDIPARSFLKSGSLSVSEPPAFYGKLSSEEETLLSLFRTIRSQKIKNMVITAVEAIAKNEK